MSRTAEIERLIERGIALYERGDVDNALVSWEAALALDPDNPRANGYVDYVREHYEALVAPTDPSAEEPFGVSVAARPEYRVKIAPFGGGPGKPVRAELGIDEGWSIEADPFEQPPLAPLPVVRPLAELLAPQVGAVATSEVLGGAVSGFIDSDAGAERDPSKESKSIIIDAALLGRSGHASVPPPASAVGEISSRATFEDEGFAGPDADTTDGVPSVVIRAASERNDRDPVTDEPVEFAAFDVEPDAVAPDAVEPDAVEPDAVGNAMSLDLAHNLLRDPPVADGAARPDAGADDIELLDADALDDFSVLGPAGRSDIGIPALPTTGTVETAPVVDEASVLAAALFGEVDLAPRQLVAMEALADSSGNPFGDAPTTGQFPRDNGFVSARAPRRSAPPVFQMSISAPEATPPQRAPSESGRANVLGGDAFRDLNDAETPPYGYDPQALHGPTVDVDPDELAAATDVSNFEAATVETGEALSYSEIQVEADGRVLSHEATAEEDDVSLEFGPSGSLANIDRVALLPGDVDAQVIAAAEAVPVALGMSDLELGPVDSSPVRTPSFAGLDLEPVRERSRSQRLPATRPVTTPPLGVSTSEPRVELVSAVGLDFELGPSGLDDLELGQAGTEAGRREFAARNQAPLEITSYHADRSAPQGQAVAPLDATADLDDLIATPSAPTRELRPNPLTNPPMGRAATAPALGDDPLAAPAAALVALVDMGAPNNESPDDRVRRRITALVELAQREVSRDLVRAAHAAELALAEDPQSALGQKLVQRHRDSILQVMGQYLGDMDRIAKLGKPLAELSKMALSPRAAFLLSRIDGSLSFEELLDVSGMPRLEAYRYLCQLKMRGIVQ